MKISKIAVIILLFTVFGLGIFLSVRHFSQSKKTVSVSVADLANSSQESATNINVEQIDAVKETKSDDVTNDLQKNDKHDSLATDNMPPLITADPKKETTNTAPIKENSKATNEKIESRLVSWGFQKSSGRTIKAIIIHTSYNNLGGNVFDFDKVMQEWKDAGVSPHYAIDRDGTTYQLVADQNIAWHAGVSKLPDGTTDVNGTSIGIEVVNSQDAKFTADQYDALNSLIASLKAKYGIKYVLGHDDIAPGRKTDPWGIDWGKISI